MNSIEVRREALDSPVAAALIGALNAELASRYPEEGDCHFRLSLDEVAPGRGAYFVAWVGAEALGCGAVRRLDGDDAEIKRMYVAERARGRGLGRALLAALEDEARRLGVRRLLLETGRRQPEAMGLYRSSGFAEVSPFGEYVGSPMSICMAKDIPSP
jgi:GNAT superfamily N-acetyltransferase